MKHLACPNCGVQLDLGDEVSEIQEASLEVIVEDLFDKLTAVVPASDYAIAVSPLGDNLGYKVSVIADAEVLMGRASSPTLVGAISLAAGRSLVNLEQMQEDLAKAIEGLEDSE